MKIVNVKFIEEVFFLEPETLKLENQGSMHLLALISRPEKSHKTPKGRVLFSWIGIHFFGDRS